MVESRRPGDVLGLSIVACFGFGGWNVADGFKQAPVVEPVHPFQGGELDGFQSAPWSAAPDHLGLVEAVDRLGQGVVIGIADAADRRFDASVGETLGVLDSDILRPAIGMMNETAAFGRSAVVERLLQGIQDKAGVCGARYPPANDPPGKGFDDEGHIDEALPRREWSRKR